MKCWSKYLNLILALLVFYSFGVSANKSVLCFEQDGSTNIEYAKVKNCCDSSHHSETGQGLEASENCHGCEDLDISNAQEINSNSKSLLLTYSLFPTVRYYGAYPDSKGDRQWEAIHKHPVNLSLLFKKSTVLII